MHLSLYLLFPVGKQNASAVSMAHAALKWVHGILLLKGDLDAFICRNMVHAEKEYDCQEGDQHL